LERHGSIPGRSRVKAAAPLERGEAPDGFPLRGPASARVASVLVARGQALPGPEAMAALEEIAGE
jgi:hypothetical protein